jgi:hypothetical protein
MSVKNIVEMLSRPVGGGHNLDEEDDFLVKDLRQDIVKNKYERYSINTVSEADLGSFISKIVNRSGGNKNDNLSEFNTGSKKPSLVEGLGELSGAYRTVDAQPDKPKKSFRVNAVDLELDPVENEQIHQIREDLNSQGIHQSTMYDYVKMAYICRKGLHRSDQSDTV